MLNCKRKKQRCRKYCTAENRQKGIIMNNAMLKQAAYALRNALRNGTLEEPFDSKELANCVINHAAASAIAAMAGGCFTGAAGFIALAISVGAIWKMYIEICRIIKVKIGKNKLKTLASAVLANITTQFAGVIAMEILVSFIPGAAFFICGACNFATVYFAGLVFLKVLTGIFMAGGDIASADVDDIKAQCSAEVKSTNAKDIYAEAKGAFKEMKDSGTLDDAGKGVDISDADDE